MKLVILVSASNVDAQKAKYSQWIDNDRVIYAMSNTIYASEWARDAFPVPAINSITGKTHLVSAKYFRDFKAGQDLADAVSFSIEKFNFTFVGGNILADSEGNCFVVNSSRLFNTTAQDFESAYGCASVHFMKHVAGIGDVDEVLKPLGGKKILTNRSEYVADLESWGYEVIMLPQLVHNRTYANSIILNGTVFMPTYNLPTDVDAANVYKSLGYKVVNIPSEEMSERYQGSVHCQTMAYPAMQQSQLFEALSLTQVH